MLNRITLVIVLAMLPLIPGCRQQGQPSVPNTGLQAANLATAERFIDAFYSWDADALGQVLMHAKTDAANALYYQAWAQAGNYQIQQRQSCQLGPSSIDCAITVTDDIGAALDYVATDTFHLAVDDGRLHGVKFSSDDPPVLQQVLAWMQAEQPAVFTGPCKDLFAGGTTPKACVRAVVAGAKSYVHHNATGR